MERARIRQILLEIFEETRGEPFGELDEQTNMREGLGLDSVDLICMIVEVQHRLGVHVTQAEMAPVVRVGDLLDLLESRLAQQPRRAA